MGGGAPEALEEALVSRCKLCRAVGMGLYAYVLSDMQDEAAKAMDSFFGSENGKDVDGRIRVLYAREGPVGVHSARKTSSGGPRHRRRVPTKHRHLGLLAGCMLHDVYHASI